eukprot:77277_1
MQIMDFKLMCVCKICGKSWKYFKIFLLALIGFFSVWGIYTFLSDVKQIKVNYHQSDTYSGILCVVSLSGHGDKDHCDNMAKQMANSAQINPNWSCASYTNYESKHLYDELSDLSHFIYSLFICSAILNFFAMIHDCTIIYKRNKLSEIKMFPQTQDEFCCIKRERWGGYPCCQILLCGIPEYFIFHLILFPIYYQCKHLLLRIYSGPNNNYLKGIFYVSSAWVGTASFCMVLLALTSTFYAYEGLSRSITPLSDECECFCLFMLNSNDFWALLLVSYILAIVNMLFFIRWVNEAKHGKHYLYLVTYRLPMFLATQINNDDPSGSMFNDKTNKNTLKLRISNDDEEQKQDSDTDTTIIDSTIIDSNTCNQYFRNYVYRSIIAFCMIIIPAQCLSYGDKNPYNYDQWIATIIYWTGGSIYILYGLTCFCGILFLCVYSCCPCTREEEMNDMPEHELLVQ